MRLTKQSVANVKVADVIEIYPTADGERFYCMVSRKGVVGLLQGSEGPMLFPSAEAVRRSVRRLNKEAEIILMPSI
jgi:hypothetical protein